MPRKGRHDAEDYLELIYIMLWEERQDQVETTVLASRLKTFPSTVTEALQKLSSRGYLKYKRYHGVTLTFRGQERAVQTLTKHRILERFFSDFLNLDPSSLQREICDLEHHISGKVMESLCKLLDSPDVCPHGKPIPCAKACKDLGRCIVHEHHVFK